MLYRCLVRRTGIPQLCPFPFHRRAFGSCCSGKPFPFPRLFIETAVVGVSKTTRKAAVPTAMRVRTLEPGGSDHERGCIHRSLVQVSAAAEVFKWPVLR